MPHDARLPFHRMNLPAGVGAGLKAAREGAGRSRRDVAAAAGIGMRTLARIERDQQKPVWPTLKRLCEELGLSDYAVAPRWSVDADTCQQTRSSCPASAFARSAASAG